MKIAIINSSPRKENSYRITKYIKNNFSKKSDFEILNLSKINLNYCIACGWCKNKKGHCVKNDELDEFFKKVIEFDGFILISPVYMGGMTAQMKTFIDRTVSLRRKDFVLKNKIGVSISIGASRNGGQELVIQNMHAAMHINGMIVVGDNNHFGGTIMSPFETDEFGKKTVDETIKKLIETINLIKK